MTADYHVSDYDFQLPERLIAQHPVENREDSRLMVLKGGKGSPEISSFFNLLEYLPPNSVLVANNSKVVPARLRGKKADQGRVELVLLSPLDLLLNATSRNGNAFSVEANVLLRPSKALRPGTELSFPGLQATILKKSSLGHCTVRLDWEDKTLLEILNAHGEIPLPPYIKRSPGAEDAARYQTVYASDSEIGSIAAPTAGLHFSEKLKSNIIAAGHTWCELTLFVGYGTFSPIRCEDIREHDMHPEYVKISSQAAETISKAMREKQPIIAVGTTSLRTIEGVIQRHGAFAPYQGWLDTYIYPGFSFKAITGLITNFHLPRSSLLVLVSALAGRERILAAYQKAVEENMRFFSYGDAMLIDKT